MATVPQIDYLLVERALLGGLPLDQLNLADYWLRVFDFECSAKYSVGCMDTRNPRRTPITVGNRMFG
jgi:hypothetical protein